MLLNCFENFGSSNPLFEDYFISKEAPKDKAPAKAERKKGPSLRAMDAIAGREKPGEHLEKEEKKPKPKPKEAPEPKPAEKAAPTEEEKLSPKKRKEFKIDKIRKEARKGRKEIYERLERLGIFKDEAERLKYVEKIHEAIERLSPDKLYEFVKNHQTYNGNYPQWNKDFCNLLLEAGVVKSEDVKTKPQRRKYVAGLQAFLTANFAETDPPVMFELKKGKSINRFTYVDGMLGGYTMSVLGAYLTKLYRNGNPKWEKLYAKLHPDWADKRKGRQEEFDHAIDYLKKQLVEVKAAPKEEKAPPVAKAPEEKPTEEKPAEEAPDKEEKPEVEELSPEEKEREEKQTEILTKKVCHHGIWKTWWLELLKKKQRVDFKWLNEEKERDPHAWWWKNNFDDEKGSWPDQAWSEYVVAYDEAKETGARDYEIAADAAFKRLNESLDDYYDQSVEINNYLKGKYKKKMENVVRTYRLPLNVNVAELNPVTTTITTDIDAGSRSIESKNFQYTKQERKIRLSHLRKSKRIEKFFGDHFKDKKKHPKEIYRNWSDLVKDLESSEHIKTELTGMNEGEICKQVNEMILLRNMYSVHYETQKLKVEFEKEFDDALAQLGKKYDVYKDKGKKNFVADILGGRAPRKKG